MGLRKAFRALVKGMPPGEHIRRELSYRTALGNHKKLLVS
jgi:hypothetical protein